MDRKVKNEKENILKHVKAECFLCPSIVKVSAKVVKIISKGTFRLGLSAPTGP